jgi:hypothetical protein
MQIGKHLRTLLWLFALASAGQAHAQATRTWVSGVGDDANPCSRTAPCKTFAGAISKTATGGEIDTLDPGGFGGVTITKSITIASEGTGEAGVLVSGTNGIVVNAPTGSLVNLRGLQIEGLGTGLSGVLVLGGDVHIENCVIRNFRGNPGVGVNSQAGVASRVTISNSSILANQIGVRAAPTVTDSGFALTNTIIDHNLQYGILGVGGFARISIDRMSVKGNGVGISAPAPAKMYSFGNNAINGLEAGTTLVSTPLQ